MIICVITPGVPHAVSRTLAFSEYFTEVHFIDMRGNADRDKLEAAGIRYHQPDQLALPGPNSLHLIKLLRSISPDVIIVHFCSGPHFFSAIAYGQCPITGIVMGSDVLYERGDKMVPGLRRLLVRLGVRRLAYISAKAAFLAQRCHEYGARNPVAINYWGADTRIFTPQDSGKARQFLHLPEDRVIILSPRTLSPLYSIDIIIAAMNTVISQEPTALLVIIGKEAPAYRKQLDLQIVESGLQDHVQIIGQVTFDDIQNWYAAADLVVSMAKTDGFPNTVLEVMCCKRPVIVGRIPQIEEILRDGVDCRLVDIDCLSLANCIAELMTDPHHTQTLAEAGYQKALEVADIQRNGRTFAADLKQAIGNYRKNSTSRLLLYRFIFFLYAVQHKLMANDRTPEANE